MLKNTWCAAGASFLSFSKALCVCQSRICSVSLLTVVCQRKIGNKKEREKEKTRKQTYQRHIRAKVDHVQTCVFLPPHAISRAGCTQFVRWSGREWCCVCFTPGGGDALFEEGVFTSVLAVPATLPLRRSSGCARRWIRWRELRRAIPYLPFPSDPAPAFWDRWRHPHLTSCRQFWLITHMIPSWISLMAFHLKRSDAAPRSLGEPWLHT